jgi:hypothetical protein
VTLKEMEMGKLLRFQTKWARAWAQYNMRVRESRLRQEARGAGGQGLDADVERLPEDPSSEAICGRRSTDPSGAADRSSD